MLNIASVRLCTQAEGPGKRMTIWLQGCLKRCFNCCNPHMQPLVKKELMQEGALIEQIYLASEKYQICGITLLGGEPLLQAKGLLPVVRWCKQNNLSVLLFSGYTLAQIQKLPLEGAQELLDFVDVLVDGEYVDSLYDESRGIVGSSNQEIHFFTDTYSLKDFKSQVQVEVLVDEQGVKFNGWALSPKDLGAFKA
ncbi:4Fe-4S single cluster domain-containing protein [Helicobacter felis]|uniref:Anaerobic ribonucleoside-triphosphate reductase-activating protein n=1 Tax=Helicobacter felis (strain ATCC 49179 / CCUG 28539 / NCTC 12436 / CS1) TaxID=936155 RepID=E7AB89_HELFC|nr:4Fe-4S single cluster domain-containing protein [Helicobacter felis]CBY83647.1 Anaerobic ribonucleoside-triphosphate reductase [Helicobacter felis ATCC 49179]